MSTQQRDRHAWTFFLREFPRQTLLMIGLFVLAGVVESVGAISVVPLLGGLLGDGGPPQGVVAKIYGFFTALGVEPTLTAMLVFLCSAMVVKALLSLLAFQQTGSVVAEVMTRLRLSLLDGLIHAKWPYFMSQESGRLIVALSTESSQAGMAMRCFAQVVSFIVQAAAYLCVGVAVSWQVMVAGLVCGGIFIFLFRRLIGSVRRTGERQVGTLNMMTSAFTDFLSGMKPLKSMGLEQGVMRYIEGQAQLNKAAAQKQVLGIGLLTSVQEPFITIFLCLGIGLAIPLAGIEPAALLAMAFFFHRIVSRFSSAQQYWQIYASQESALISLRDKVEMAKANRMDRGGSRKVALNSEISLDQVSFGYAERDILTAFDMTVPVGRVTALYGPSGSGKTTVADLIVGLISPDRGRIMVDDTPLAEADMAAWRSGIGYVPQEVFLFHDTVRNNILLGRDFDDQAVWGALERAGAAEFVRRMDGQLDADVGEHGRAVSGGQRQRLMIARALLASPRVLILDEATTGLDESTEAAILDSVAALKPDMAVLVISHQPAVKKIADQMVVLG